MRQLLAYYIILAVCALPLFSVAQSGNPTLNIVVSINADTTKAVLLEQLTTKYDLHFSYNPLLLNANEHVSLHIENKPLYEVLQKIIGKTELTYKAFDKQIVLFPKDVSPKPSQEMAFFTLKGSVTELRKNEPIPFCNISIVGKAMGTMTNGEGKFSVKIPLEHSGDTLGFSALGFETFFLPIDQLKNDELSVKLSKKTYNLKTIDVIHYDPHYLLQQFDLRRATNYDNEYALFTTFYRELTRENKTYTDISEAVLKVMKAPYFDTQLDDHIKFVKGRKGAEIKPLHNIKFKLKGGPYFITKLDVVKHDESFINPELRHLYTYNFEQLTSIDNRQTAIVSFKPIKNLRDVLFEGKLYFDLETWGLARVEFRYTTQGLKMEQNSLILKEPKKHKAIPTALSYIIQYKYTNQMWRLSSSRSSFNITIRNKEKREKTKFYSVAELLVTNIEKGDFQHFSRKESFKSNEIFTEKIVSYDKLFWENYNTIRPEEELEKALKNFDDQNLIIIYHE